MRRPKVALIVTSYFAGSHADVVATRLIEGYEWLDEHVDARVEVAGLYLEQLGAHVPSGERRSDIGVEIARRNGVEIYPTVGETLACGGTGVAVDGVVIIGEHGDYEENEFGQKLYPRRRLFDAAVSSMITAGRYVPIFNDKGLSYSADDALEMVGTARRLGIPLAAGSTIPLSWRVPADAQWPLGEPMTDVVAVGWGEAESYGFHTLEGMQAYAERRSGGETGVIAVQCYSDDRARQACIDGTVDAELLAQAFASLDLDETGTERARRGVHEVFVVEYADGLRGVAVTCDDDAVRNWSVACRGPGHATACLIYLPGAYPGPTEHFILQTRQIESLVLTGEEPSPPERTLITTAVLDTAMRSRHASGVRIETPRLSDITYQAPDVTVDSGVGRVYPQPVQREGLAVRPVARWD